MRSEPPTGDELTRMLVTVKQNVVEQVAQEPRPQRPVGLGDRVVALAIGIAILLGLGAGAAFAFGVVPSFVIDPITAPAPVQTSAPAPTPTETATPTPAAPTVAPPVIGTQPAARYDLSCDGMVDPSTVAALFPVEVGPVDPIVTASKVSSGIPRITSVLAVGGTVCEWSNGMGYNSVVGSNDQYLGVTVSIVPRPVDGWSDEATRMGMPQDYSGCTTVCTASAAVGDAWIAIEAQPGDPNVVAASAWQAFVDEIVAAVAAAGPAAAEDDSGRLPLTCDDVIPLETAQAVLGYPEAIVSGAGGGWSEWAEAREHTGYDLCFWAPTFDDDAVAWMEVVSEGRWAFDRMLQAGESEATELVGLGPEDEAVLRCDPMFGTACAIDLRIGPDWISIRGEDEATAVGLAEAAVAHLAP
ncbi:hypothetical protein SAMN05428970_2810 [Agromyces sp. CF514]|uniref:hypothetical protein n=1 Tax=Agromyces sp. CF514 TaxID=1881031 RepID=UPI0008E38B89|nr:hypothetical protein [Agromyces sp. CF514]SFR83487.1 hypothetical protein SAMN05428970_2810 [Agromyces sp. CF514]